MTRHFSDVFSSAAHEYFGPIDQKSKYFRKKRQISTNIDKYHFLLKCFWLMGPKYSCSADGNTSEKCLVLFFFGGGLNFLLFFQKYAGLGKFFEVRI